MNGAKINVVGNLVKEPEVKNLSNGQKVVNFSIAAATRNKVGDSYSTDFYSVAVWGKLGETVMNRCTKGTTVFVSGDFFTRTYAKKDGSNGIDLHIEAVDVIPVRNTKGEARTAAASMSPNPDAVVAPTQLDEADDKLPF